MAIVFKAIKPTTLRKDAFRLEFLSMMHKAEREMIKDFRLTAETWEHKPVFQSQISLIGGPSLLVGTDDEIYGYVNNGTPSHVIQPKLASVLSFQTDFTPKTVPGVIGSKSGGKSGPRRRAKAVQHPGFEARKFDDTIQKKWKPIFKDRSHEAMKKAAQKSGHGVT